MKLFFSNVSGSDFGSLGGGAKLLGIETAQSLDSISNLKGKRAPRSVPNLFLAEYVPLHQESETSSLCCLRPDQVAHK